MRLKILVGLTPRILTQRRRILKISFDCETQLFEGVWSATSRYSFEPLGIQRRRRRKRIRTHRHEYRLTSHRRLILCHFLPPRCYFRRLHRVLTVPGCFFACNMSTRWWKTCENSARRTSHCGLFAALCVKTVVFSCFFVPKNLRPSPRVLNCFTQGSIFKWNRLTEL